MVSCTQTHSLTHSPPHSPPHSLTHILTHILTPRARFPPPMHPRCHVLTPCARFHRPCILGVMYSHTVTAAAAAAATAAARRPSTPRLSALLVSRGLSVTSPNSSSTKTLRNLLLPDAHASPPTSRSPASASALPQTFRQSGAYGRLLLLLIPYFGIAVAHPLQI